MDQSAKDLVIVRIDGGICSQINFFAYGHAIQNMLGGKAKVKYDLSWFRENGKDYFGKFVRNWDFPKAFPDLAVEEASAEEIAATKKRRRRISPRITGRLGRSRNALSSSRRTTGRVRSPTWTF